MVRSFIKNSSLFVFALCAGCGAEDPGPVDGEVGIDTVEEALGGNWVSGTGTGMFSFGGRTVCEGKSGVGVLQYWYPGYLLGSPARCVYRDLFGNNTGSGTIKTLRGGPYALSHSSFPEPSDGLKVSGDGPLDARVCVVQVSGASYVGWVRNGRCEFNNGSSSNFYWVTWGI